MCFVFVIVLVCVDVLCCVCGGVAFVPDGMCVVVLLYCGYR